MPLARAFSWLSTLFQTAPRSYTCNGVGLEKVLVYAQGREATIDEMMSVVMDSRFTLKDGGANSKLNCSTEKWYSRPDEDLSSAVKRIAREVGDVYPALFVTALVWPGSDSSMIAVIVTETTFPLPLSLRNVVAVIGPGQ